MNGNMLPLIVAWTAIASAAAGLLYAADQPSEKPNLVLFMSDDHGYADSGVYGDRTVRTPNIDRLAAQSMRFTRAFAASPICTVREKNSMI